MSTITTSAPAHSIDSLLKQAKTAVHKGKRQQARRLMQQAVRQDPQDFRGWLWLATVAQSPQASLEYVSRAEMLAPNNRTVQKARLWAEKRLEQIPANEPITLTATPETSRSRIQNVHWLALALIVLLVVGISGTYIWQQFQTSDAAVETAVLNSSLASVSKNETNFVAEAVAVSAESIATGTPQPHVPAKLVASTGANQPRPTWTVTPTPSPTPTPTPTVIPTFVNPNYQDGVRPFGVGANERWVDVNLTTQTLRAYEGDTVVFTTLISSGTWDHPTVTGQFRVWLEYESQTMDGRLLGYDYFLENVPYVMYFFQDYAIHGTYWHNNFGNPMSHGCVNMETGDAGWIYNFVTVGTLVNVHY